MSVAVQKVAGSNVPDSTGSPMNISTIVNYVVKDPVASTFNVENVSNFIHT